MSQLIFLEQFKNISDNRFIPENYRDLASFHTW